jgi:hypothetical protein
MIISENEQRDVADEHRRDASEANDDDLNRSQKQAESLEEDDWTMNVSSRRGVPKRSEDDANDKYGPIMAEGKAQSIAARRPNIHGEPIYTERRGSKGVC